MKIFIVGATGRMGRELRQLIEADSKLTFAGGLGTRADEGDLVSSLAKAPKNLRKRAGMHSTPSSTVSSKEKTPGKSSTMCSRI